jgi:hypothetical protein
MGYKTSRLLYLWYESLYLHTYGLTECGSLGETAMPSAQRQSASQPKPVPPPEPQNTHDNFGTIVSGWIEVQ